MFPAFARGYHRLFPGIREGSCLTMLLPSVSSMETAAAASMVSLCLGIAWVYRGRLEVSPWEEVEVNYTEQRLEGTSRLILAGRRNHGRRGAKEECGPDYR